MNDTPSTSSARERVLTAIRNKRISMRPKFLFALTAIGTVLTALLVLIVSVALASFILFSIRWGGHDVLLSFGPRGVLSFLAVFPWLLLVLDAGLIVLLEALLRRFSFGYRSPVLYLLIALVAFSGAAGLALDRGTSFNDDLLNRADHGGLPPPLGELYEHARQPVSPDEGIFRGVITSVGTSSVMMSQDDLDRDGDDGAYTVMLPAGASPDTFSVGEHVYVAGDRDGDIVHAYGIRAFERH